MRALVTGGGGFVGTRLAQLLIKRDDIEQITLFDTRFAAAPQHPKLRYVEGDLRETASRVEGLQGGPQLIFHLATVPGGAAEQNYALARQVNVDATLDLFEDAAAAADCPRVVFASSIAVFGEPLPAMIEDATEKLPTMTYGGQKLMMEIALADFTRRKKLDGVSVRLSGVVPRPRAPSGMKSAFLSEVFHHLAEGTAFTMPMSKGATTYMISVTRIAENLMHAADVEQSALPPGGAVTLPALRLSMDELVTALLEGTGSAAGLVTYDPDPTLEPQFGRLPPLRTDAADAAGFRNDGDAAGLVRQALADMRRNG